jgi:hypothetical protein
MRTTAQHLCALRPADVNWPVSRQTVSTTLQPLGEPFGAENAKKLLQIRHHSYVPTFLYFVRFIPVTVAMFTKWKKLNLTCQPISMFAKEGREKKKSKFFPLHNFSRCLDQTNVATHKKGHQCKNVVTQTEANVKKKLFTFSAPSDPHPPPSQQPLSTEPGP